MRRTIIALAAAALIGLACGAGPRNDTAADAPPAAGQPAPTTTAAKAPGGFGEGMYEVGADIKPGKYKTTVPADAINCYWARLNSLDTSDIADNGNLSPGGKGLVQVKKADKAVEFSGACTWTAVK